MKIAVIMDDIARINYAKDTTLAMLWEASARGFELFYLELHDLFLKNEKVYGRVQELKVFKDANNWYQLRNAHEIPLSYVDIILMRKDPPVNLAYHYASTLLEQVEREGVKVVNRPSALRNCNEKLFTLLFPQCTPPTIVTMSKVKLHEFRKEHGDIVCKPLHAMAGESIFRLQAEDVNANVIFDIITQKQTMMVMAQKFIPDITAGDKRILLINGEAFPHVLARVPQPGDWRGNLAVGAKGRVQNLTEQERFICAQLATELKNRGLYFVGIDVIGDYLTEINVTSPTGLRELSDATRINIAALFWDAVVA